MDEISKIESMNDEEIKALLQDAGISFKQLAKEALELKRHKDTQKENIYNTGKKSNTDFELSLVSYPDFVITKKTPKTTVMLVIMPSCGGYYLKTIKNGSESVVELNRENYAKFSSGMETITMPDDFWLPEVYPGVGFYDNLKIIITNNDLVEIIRNHCFPKDMFNKVGWEDRWYYGKYVDKFIEMYKAIPILLKEFFTKYPDLYFWKDYNYKILYYIQETFGLNNARDFIESAAYSLINFTNHNYYTHINDDDFLTKLFSVPMKYSSFKDYVLYDAYIMGYGDDWESFLNEMVDAWNMQKELYGSIKEKYSKNLPTFHKQLSYKITKKRKNECYEKIGQRAEELEVYNITVDGFKFIVPKTAADILDEAEQQANCLAGYINKFANGDDILIFMRKADNPDKSYITIELDKEGNTIRQAYYAKNIKVSSEDYAVIEKWLKKVQTVIKSEFDNNQEALAC